MNSTNILNIFVQLVKFNWSVIFGCAIVSFLTMTVFLGPFISIGQLETLLSRLFPFHRGLYV